MYHKVPTREIVAIKFFFHPTAIGKKVSTWSALRPECVLTNSPTSVTQTPLGICGLLNLECSTNHSGCHTSLSMLLPKV